MGGCPFHSTSLLQPVTVAVQRTERYGKKKKREKEAERGFFHSQHVNRVKAK